MIQILILASVAVAAIATLPAHADPAPVPSPAPSGPCQRGETTIHMSGVDIDDMKCHYAVSMQQLAVMSLEIVDRDARLRLMANDLAASQGREKILGEELAKLKAAKPADDAKPAAAKP